jgi:hypothetical protein
METRQKLKNDLRKLKNDLRKLRDVVEAEQLEGNGASITAELENLDHELRPRVVTYNGKETWSDMVVKLKQDPRMATLLNALDQAVFSTDNKFVWYKETPAAKGIRASMDRFQSDMEDELKDLRGSTRFKIRMHI